MKTYVGQVYIDGRASYRFSTMFQKKIHAELTQLILPSDDFISEYGEDFNLMFNMSAKSHLKKNEVRGPTVFRKDKDVEYTIFLPFDLKTPLDEAKRRFALENLFAGIIEVLEKYNIECDKILSEQKRIIEDILADPTMNRGKRWDED